ncbi:SDR family NAD(P)-dependent oxidoreductase [Umezawaea sp. Da 62-37]|uniref:SDR family NAD(P)-dependent oxidoreductase n=1 Tax=Umezawaea sp. Da 62-37 TaxID=3075927 RepID=UPI0028F712C6|nr:SDR family NAD(P)-dependent oxidoreductase [Umezawaea sp. Da 62-37]WNV84520.1 SDR family NAD(P)-dependent oxidoreductase [Umezawaea sp. Da 62-37]
MTTTVITGGTDGIGRALAVHRLRRGGTVVVVGRSRTKFDALVAAAGGSGSAHFIGADLRLVAENLRVAGEVATAFPVVDALVLAAAYVHRKRVVTEEGFEHTFALHYLSRHLLATRLRPSLQAASAPLVLDTTVPGAPADAVRWEDMQLEDGFTWKAANLHTRRLGLLSGLRVGTDHLRYALYNPGFVRTAHQGALNGPERAVVNLLGRTLGTAPEKAVLPLADLIGNRPDAPLSAYAGRKRLPLAIDAADHADAERLHAVTEELPTPFATR